MTFLYRQHTPGDEDWGPWQRLPWSAMAAPTPHRWACNLLDGIDGRIVTVADTSGQYQWRFLTERADRAD